ncbi:MAG: gamma-glutamyltransferase, partial [Acidimicrobiia bacterium]|nr:gamma-glutamyltransferase [Acidimicrobiia bacterium]
MSSNAVATPHLLSTEAGRHALTRGGNAVDAAIAAIAAQGVVAPETCGIGGDLFALVHFPGWDRPRALNASGRAGSRVDASTLREAGLDEIPRDHPATVTIPGCVDGLAELSRSFGRLSLAECLEPAITLAQRGFEVSSEQASAFGRMADVYSGNPAVSDFYPRGSAVTEGEIVTRPALARTLQSVAQEGRDAFYAGKAGDDIVAAVGGLITLEDLAASQAEWVDPIGVEVAGLIGWTTPPNSQGYLGPGALAVFESLGPPDDPDHPEWWHLLIEAYRCLAWERDDIVADPDHAPLPARLMLDAGRLARASESVQRGRAGSWPRPMGMEGDTAYLCTADSDGVAVSMIQSNYRGTGSAFGATRSGFLLQDRGGGFSLMPGHPNELAPGKRPLHTLSPTLWTEDSNARWLLGTRGGAVQPQLVAQVGARAIVRGTDLGAALAAPRWTVTDFGPQATPEIMVEPDVDPSILERLRSMGYSFSLASGPRPGWGPVSAIELEGNERRTARDERVATT